MPRGLAAIAVALAASSGCAHHTPAQVARYIDTTLLATSTAAIACDWGFTHAAASDDWRGTRELNPMLGPRPTTGEVNAYFVSMIALNAAVWVLTPPRFRGALPLAVTVRQSYAIAYNTGNFGGVCGQ